MKKIIIISLIAAILVGIFWFSKKLHSTSNNDQNVIKVGITADYPPFVYLENHKIVGFDIDLINEIAKKLDKKIQFIDMAFNVLITGIQQGKIDIIVGGLTPDDQRKNHVFFTKPYLTDDPLVMVTLAPQKAKTVADLKEKIVIVNEGYTADLYMSKIDGPILKRLPSVSDAIMALKAGKAFAFVSALTAINPYFKQYGKEQFNINPIENVTEEYAFVISQKRADIYQKVEAVLNDLIAHGTVEKLKEKWKLYD